MRNHRQEMETCLILPESEQCISDYAKSKNEKYHPKENHRSDAEIIEEC